MLSLIMNNDVSLRAKGVVSFFLTRLSASRTLPLCFGKKKKKIVPRKYDFFINHCL